MDFDNKKRQEFLQESYYLNMVQEIENSRVFWLSNFPESDSKAEGESLKASIIASDNLELFFINYTAGMGFNELRVQLEEVIISYEKYTYALRAYEKEMDNENYAIMAPLLMHDLEDYENILEIISLCILLHRKDLLIRFVGLIDPYYESTDIIYEEILSFELDDRFDVSKLIFKKPYQILVDVIFNNSDNDRIKALTKYLKEWYPSFKDTPWYGSHENIIDDDGNYYGYWSFEAGALAFLNELDDSDIDHMVYPKDLVKFAKEFVPSANDISVSKKERLRCEAGQICPKTGEWYSPANNMEKRYFTQSEVMPEIKDNPWGLTIWYKTE